MALPIFNVVLIFHSCSVYLPALFFSYSNGTGIKNWHSVLSSLMTGSPIAEDNYHTTRVMEVKMKFIRFIKETAFVVTRKGETVITMPTAVFALLMLFFWQILIPIIIIALFFDVGYFFEGDFSKEGRGSGCSEDL